jgi:hypothetical protein
MWSPRNHRERTTVVCIACGDAILRSEAREYDKEGDRFDRRGKEFEHLCRECHDDLCHQPRGDLESLLCAIGAGELDRSTFLERYAAAAESEGTGSNDAGGFDRPDGDRLDGERLDGDRLDGDRSDPDRLDGDRPDLDRRDDRDRGR